MELKQAGITKIISSPLIRAKQTAKIISKELGLPIETWPELREMDFKKYGEAPFEKLRKELNISSQELLIYKLLQGGMTESLESIKKRTEIFWEKVQKAAFGEKTLVIGHEVFFRVLNIDHCEKIGMAAVSKPLKWNNAEWKTYQLPTEELTQDQNTLDTWFSSALWPFAILGWPDQEHPDLRKFYPNAVLETGWDILFFWVARMIMFGRYATGKYPFETTYLHGMVTDEHGKKMSKSKGNGINPLDEIKEVGADAVRLSLVIGTTPGNNIPLGKQKIAGYRNFVNKLWNAGRFIQLKKQDSEDKNITDDLLSRWIQTRLTQVSKAMIKDLENYHISAAGDKLYNFVWSEFCDWFIEGCKNQPHSKVGQEVYKNILRLAHPFCPFVTEKIWQELECSSTSLVNENFPKLTYNDPEALQEFEQIKEAVVQVRSWRLENKISPGQFIKITMHDIPDQNTQLIALLAKGQIIAKHDDPGKTIRIGGGKIVLPAMKKKIDNTAAIAECQAKITNLSARLANTNYCQKAPAVLVQASKDELKTHTEKLQLLQAEHANA